MRQLISSAVNTVSIMSKEMLCNLDRMRFCAEEPKQRNSKYAHSEHPSKATLYNLWMITAGNKCKIQLIQHYHQ